MAPSATVIGDVCLSPRASVWFGAVVRGDRGAVHIGTNSNIQDRAVLTVGVTIGDGVTVGHGAMLSDCVVGDGALIGMGAIVQDGATVGAGAVVAAGAVVLPDTAIPANELWAGNPAVFKKKVDLKGSNGADGYAKLSTQYSA